MAPACTFHHFLREQIHYAGLVFRVLVKARGTIRLAGTLRFLQSPSDGQLESMMMSCPLCRKKRRRFLLLCAILFVTECRLPRNAARDFILFVCLFCPVVECHRSVLPSAHKPSQRLIDLVMNQLVNYLIRRTLWVSVEWL